MRLGPAWWDESLFQSMPQDRMRTNLRTGALTGSIRQRYLRADPSETAEYVPVFYLEAKIDMADVRSGFRESLSVNRSFEIVPLEGDALWTEDMVHPVDPALIADKPPDRAKLLPLPDFVTHEHLRCVERQFLSYLLRHFEVRIYYNHTLNLYSAAGEARTDFAVRCLEALESSFRQDLDGLREVFERRIEQSKERHLRVEPWGDPEPDRVATQVRNRIHETSERISDMFVRAELGRNPPSHSRSESPGDELDERLAWIEAEASEAVRRLMAEYLAKAGDLDEYAVRPSLKDIQVGSASILWVPVEARR